MNNYEHSVKLEEVAHCKMTTKMKGLFIASHPVLPWSWFWFLFEQLVTVAYEAAGAAAPHAW